MDKKVAKLFFINLFIIAINVYDVENTLHRTGKYCGVKLRLSNPFALNERLLCYGEIPICGGKCLTRDSMYAHGIEIVTGIKCNCCLPRSFKRMLINLTCADAITKIKIKKTVELKVPSTCHCSSELCGKYSDHKKKEYLDFNSYFDKR